MRLSVAAIIISFVLFSYEVDSEEDLIMLYIMQNNQINVLINTIFHYFYSIL